MDAILEALASYGIAGIFLAVLVYYLNKGAAVTVKAGAYFVVPEGSQITAMTIDSGSVIIYNL